MLTPQHIISRLIHNNADYFNLIPEIDRRDWKRIIAKHCEKCQFPMCLYIQNTKRYDILI